MWNHRHEPHAPLPASWRVRRRSRLSNRLPGACGCSKRLFVSVVGIGRNRAMRMTMRMIGDKDRGNTGDQRAGMSRRRLGFQHEHHSPLPIPPLRVSYSAPVGLTAMPEELPLPLVGFPSAWKREREAAVSSDHRHGQTEREPQGCESILA